MKKIEWGNPNDILNVIKVTPTKYAENFIKKGTIKFSRPKDWRFNSNDAIGDPYEGAVARCDKWDVSMLSDFWCDYPNDRYERYCNNEMCFIYSNRTQNLPCFCMFGVFVDSLQFSQNNSGQDLVTECNLSKFLDDSKKMSIIFINNFQKFREKLISALKSFGFIDSEILIARERYFDYEQYDRDGIKGFIEIPQGNIPTELICKSKKYEYQKELRIIINSDNSQLTEKLLSNNIEIGDISEFAIETDLTPENIKLIYRNPKIVSKNCI